MQSQEPQTCWRLKFLSDLNEEVVLLGLIVDQDGDFVTLKTGSGRLYTIARSHLLLLHQTKIPFRGDGL